MYPVSNRPTMIQLLLLAVILLQAAASAESNCPDIKCLLECQEFEKDFNGCELCKCVVLPSDIERYLAVMKKRAEEAEEAALKAVREAFRLSGQPAVY